ncbi:hypothetical protein GUITHDRAFT_105686 [Guillardia theta CCMP2712]|uniref:Uncharacterized protein n=1 Tax=Guillardia theta (strain CCMP2712) TaxID=905079 RepID=L1JK63_GUITC|nr:hypothetical protein GUITHDRAFT_105686 [Guillardia theta CCMP2712]EKX48544.1 hypothetical protein GUITHDRAFT_105686 [Guillardia theta CCMP2712]|eukprot:XP_005835524.1 hypothetical protein GUITHDRAFT_105686 [Guillardia theta CCMP2712]
MYVESPPRYLNYPLPAPPGRSFIDSLRWRQSFGLPAFESLTPTQSKCWLRLVVFYGSSRFRSTQSPTRPLQGVKSSCGSFYDNWLFICSLKVLNNARSFQGGNEHQAAYRELRKSVVRMKSLIQEGVSLSSQEDWQLGRGAVLTLIDSCKCFASMSLIVANLRGDHEQGRSSILQDSADALALVTGRIASMFNGGRCWEDVASQAGSGMELLQGTEVLAFDLVWLCDAMNEPPRAPSWRKSHFVVWNTIREDSDSSLVCLHALDLILVSLSTIMYMNKPSTQDHVKGLLHKLQSLTCKFMTPKNVKRRAGESDTIRQLLVWRRDRGAQQTGSTADEDAAAQPKISFRCYLSLLHSKCCYILACCHFLQGSFQESLEAVKSSDLLQPHVLYLEGCLRLLLSQELVQGELQASHKPLQEDEGSEESREDGRPAKRQRKEGKEETGRTRGREHLVRAIEAFRSCEAKKYRPTEALNASAQCLAILADMSRRSNLSEGRDRMSQKGAEATSERPAASLNQSVPMNHSDLETIQEFEKCLKQSDEDDEDDEEYDDGRDYDDDDDDDDDAAWAKEMQANSWLPHAEEEAADEVAMKEDYIYLLLSSGEPERALQLCLQVLAQEPNSVNALKYQADALVCLERAEEALPPLDTLAALLLEAIDSLEKEGRETGGGDELLSSYREALAECYNNHSLVLTCLNQSEAAALVLNKSLQLSPNLSAAAYNHTLMLWTREQHMDASSFWLNQRSVGPRGDLVTLQQHRAHAIQELEASDARIVSHVAGYLTPSMVYALDVMVLDYCIREIEDLQSACLLESFSQP